jgi:hypothetical protein
LLYATVEFEIVPKKMYNKPIRVQNGTAQKVVSLKYNGPSFRDDV